MGLFKKDRKESNSCCCGSNDNLIAKEGTDSENNYELQAVSSVDFTYHNEFDEDKNPVVIKILGSGCKNCITLADHVKDALVEMKLEAKIIKVTDFTEISGYGVMSTPALVVNEKVVSYGKVLKTKEVVKILSTTLEV